MNDCMPSPTNWKEFLQEYSFKDIREVYTNGSRLIPVFRVEQMMEHFHNKCWISVKDKMPKCGELVLIYIANLNDGKGDYALDKCRKVGGKKEWEFYNRRNADFDVTHWMPLSKPPKEGC